MGAADKIRIAEHIEVTWLPNEARLGTCPNCGAHAAMLQLLEIDYRPPDAVHRFVLQVCPACTARFVDNPETMDYSTDELIEIGWNIYQVQLGAGVWPITAPLSRIAKPAGARALEIGGAYGFGLDFCIRAHGWQGVGYDPSPLAAFGARELGLTIRQDYFEEKDLKDGPWDVVIATEVVEHLGHPPEFLRLMRRALKNDGILVLTTPDADRISPLIAAGEMMSLLSPGAHLVLQTAQSLEAALKTAGFLHVTIKRDAMSLVAYASATTFSLVEDDAPPRAMFRRYLVERAMLTDELSDLRLGFAGRGFFEAVNDADTQAAEIAWAALVPAVKARFGMDLAAPDGLPKGADDASLAELARMMPLGLGMILFGRAMQLINIGADRADLLPMLRRALAAVSALQGALAKRSLTDGLSASIRRILEAEILLCQAESGSPECMPGLLASQDVIVGWRGFVALVNAGALDLAARLKTAMLPGMPGADIPRDLRRNALLSLGNFELAPAGEPLRVLQIASALRALDEDADHLLLAAFTRLVNARRFSDAQSVWLTHDIGRLAAQSPDGYEAQDAKFSALLLELAMGDPMAIPDRLAAAALSEAREATVLVEAFIRLVNASRFTEATAFAQNHAVAALSRHHGIASAPDAAIAFAVLDLATGDPALVPGRLEGVAVDPARREALILGAFTGLVNSGRHTEAEALAARDPCFAQLETAAGPAADDARLAATLLDLQQGRTREAATRIEAQLSMGADAQTYGPLLVDSFVRLINAGEFPAAARLAQRDGVARQLPECGVPLRHDALAAMLTLELQPEGDPTRALQRLDEMSQSGVEERRVQRLAATAFVGLVNRGAFPAARQLLHIIDPILIKLAPPYDAAARDLLFSAGILFLQDRDTCRRSAAVFARLRDDLVKHTVEGEQPEALFWPALRGEVVALHHIKRGQEATEILRDLMARYPGAPDDLRQQVETATA